MTDTTETWRGKPPTDTQRKALANMRRALGAKGAETHAAPKTRGEASDEIARLKETITANLSRGGSIDPRRSVYAAGGDWGVDHDGN